MMHVLKSRDSQGSVLGRETIFLIITTSRPVLGPTQLPTQWIPGTLSLGVRRPGREPDHPSPHIAEVKHGGAIPPLLHVCSQRVASLMKHGVEIMCNRIRPNGYRGLSLGVRRPGREPDHSPPPSAEVKHGGAIPPLSHVIHSVLLH
jgi:hypothetical protein